jgi:DNA mismatch endonuclease (patch repair protein)
MADVFNKEKRSSVMTRIRGKGNRDTELALIRVLRSNQITGWRRNQRVFGKPDFVFPRAKLVVFVDGCFWHQCPRHSKVPASNADFWLRKLERNKKRDRLVNRVLKKDGWRVIRIWEHELSRKHEVVVARRIQRAIRLAEIPRQGFGTSQKMVGDDRLTSPGCYKEGFLSRPNASLFS